MTRTQYANLIRRYRDSGPDPEVHTAYIAGMNGYPRKWRPGTRRGAAFAAGRINKDKDHTNG